MRIIEEEPYCGSLGANDLPSNINNNQSVQSTLEKIRIANNKLSKRSKASIAKIVLDENSITSQQIQKQLRFSEIIKQGSEVFEKKNISEEISLPMTPEPPAENLTKFMDRLKRFSRHTGLVLIKQDEIFYKGVKAQKEANRNLIEEVDNRAYKDPIKANKKKWFNNIDRDNLSRLMLEPYSARLLDNEYHKIPNDGDSLRNSYKVKKGLGVVQDSWDRLNHKKDYLLKALGKLDYLHRIEVADFEQHKAIIHDPDYQKCRTPLKKLVNNEKPNYLSKDKLNDFKYKPGGLIKNKQMLNRYIARKELIYHMVENGSSELSFIREDREWDESSEKLFGRSLENTKGVLEGYLDQKLREAKLCHEKTVGLMEKVDQEINRVKDDDFGVNAEEGYLTSKLIRIFGLKKIY